MYISPRKDHPFKNSVSWLADFVYMPVFLEELRLMLSHSPRFAQWLFTVQDMKQARMVQQGEPHKKAQRPRHRKNTCNGPFPRQMLLSDSKNRIRISQLGASFENVLSCRSRPEALGMSETKRTYENGTCRRQRASTWFSLKQRQRTHTISFLLCVCVCVCARQIYFPQFFWKRGGKRERERKARH